jgi:starch synthase
LPHVVIVGSEAVPFAKTGGLADVLGALPAALARLGWSVTLVVPRYRGIIAGAPIDRFPMVLGDYVADVGFYEHTVSEGVRVVFVDCPELFDRDQLYGVGDRDYPDNARRFALLARAALEWTGRGGGSASVLHAHDWQAGLVPVYLKTLYASHPTLKSTPSVFTIHNLAYQGLFAPEWLPRVGLGLDQFTVGRMEFFGRASFLKGGINDAELITTVSPTYAHEIQTPALGFGFEGILRARGTDLVGILNGIDVAEWDPSRDRHLPQPFSLDDLSPKRASKREVLARYGLPIDEASLERPLIGMISRMVDQKGLDLIAEAAASLLAIDATYVVLGTGEARYQQLWRTLAAQSPERIGVRIGFDEPLAHLIEGGADMFLMPSRFEPCGLNQMYSMRYGTIPIVHKVGGLADTVRDFAPRRTRATGFVFDAYTGGALVGAIRRAVSVFKNKARWETLQRAGMRQDYSWDRSAREYVKIYERAMARRARP